MTMESRAHLEYPENFDCFRDALASALIEKMSTPTNKKRKAKSRRTAKSTAAAAAPPNKKQVKTSNAETGKLAAGKNNNNNNTHEPPTTTTAEDLADFTEYIALVAFANLPVALQSLTHCIWADTPLLQETYALPLTATDVQDLHLLQDPGLADSLVAYDILVPPDADQLCTFVAPVLTTYLSAVTAAPPPPSSTKKDAAGCEICERDWVPLTYHHLIPRFVHVKAVKRGWHRQEDLGNVAWLCRACHSFVHRFAGHEELAREYFTVDRLLAAEEVRNFAGWVSRVRWKAR